jgi:RNA polymerase sigma-70 factor (ECF subfamily)
MSAAADTPEERELIERARGGDRDAFGEIVRMYQKRVFRLARRMSRSDDDAWDITQDAFIRAMDAMERFDPQYRFFTWMYRIVVNLAINRTEKRKRRGEVQFIEEYDGGGAQVVEDQALERAAAEELADAVRSAVGRLSPPLRAVFVLRVDQGLSYGEIAETLDIAMGTVMSRLSRARKAVRESVSGLLGPEALREGGG